jgi:hypothetical protein
MSQFRPCLAMGLSLLFQPIKRKQRAAESYWRSLVATTNAEAGTAAWDAAFTAKARYEQIYLRYLLLEGDRVLPFGRLFDVGRQVVRWTEEKRKGESDRLAEYQGDGMADIARKLSEPISFSGAAEELLMENGLLRLRDQLGPKDPLVLTLAEVLPSDRAAQIVVGTKLGNEVVRKKIFATGELGEFADDPLVAFVKTIDAEARPLRQAYERKVQGNLLAYLRVVGERMGEADSMGNSRSADAGRDFRLSSGRVKGFLGFGRDVPAQTTLAGLFARAAMAVPGHQLSRHSPPGLKALASLMPARAA